MIITLTGNNAFGLRSELNRLVSSFTAEHGGLALERLDGQEASLEKLQEALTAPALLAGKKLVVLREPGSNKQFSEDFEQIFNEVPKTTDVIVVEPKLDKRTAYYKFLKKQTEFKEFAELDAAGLAKWLQSAAKERGGELPAAEARYLVERVGTNQQLLGGELEKLLLYEPKISRANINLLVESSPQSTIFQLLEAAFAGNSKRAMELYAEQRALKVEPQQIIGMLAWQLHVLSLVKAAKDRTPDQIAREAKLNPFVVRKSLNIVRGLSFQRLKTLTAELLNIDLKTKRTAINADEALRYYLLSAGL